MIIDLPRFVAAERPHWEQLERLLTRLESEPGAVLPLDEMRRFHTLYERAASDLARLRTFSSEPETLLYLESLVARGYGEIHETRQKRTALRPFHWFFVTLPRTFRRHSRAFALSVAITLVGCLFGALAVAFDPEAKEVIMPFPHLIGDPSERVKEEESGPRTDISGYQTSFSAQLMTHNTQVSILALALGMTAGVGTILLLFYNGVILGAVALDYIRAGESTFLLGWLLPHGSIEIPAIIIAGQAGLVLAGALIGWSDPTPLSERLREVSFDIVTLIAGVAILLVWAGFVESFLSQRHEPVFPYWIKITLGSIELGLLALFLGFSGSATQNQAPRK